MTTGTNLQLTYDEANDSWSYQNVDYEYPSGSTNSWSGFTSPDPEFEYTPPDQDDQEQDNSTVCPPGYIYDETLKQCLPDPNYRAPAYAGEPTGRTEPDQPGLHITSNATKETWIANANTVITSGEGAGKTGLQNYIDNLDDRGFTEVVDGKLIFKKDVTKEPGTIYQGIANMLGHQSKVNKIVHDLQRMGAINAEVTLNNKGDMVYTPQMEISNVPNTFATYNYEGGTTDWNRPGKYTGFTTPATHLLGTQTFPSTGTFGSPDYVSSWTNYINTIFQKGDTTTGFQKLTEPKLHSTVKSGAVPIGGIDTVAENEKRKNEFHQLRIAGEKEKLKQQQIKTAQKQQEKEQFNEQKDRYEKAKEREKFQTQTEKYKAEKKKQTKQPTYKSVQSGPHGKPGGVMTKPSGPKKTSSYNPKKTGYQL